MAHPYATCMKIAANQLAKLKMATCLRDPMRSRIGMFHAIVPDGLPLPDEYACSISVFQEKIDAQIARGFRFISLPQLLDMPYADAKKGFCVLTFDDGYAGVSTLAAPFLTERGIPFTVYSTTGYLGKDGYLSTEALRALSENPLCTVGSHLITHPMTRFLSHAAALTEMTESKRVLEEIVQRPVWHLAFPYGSAYACSMRDIRLAKRAGYESAALTTPTAFYKGIFGAYALPRLNLFIG